jgi:hydrogenase nickel incorporation protein HypA/HybF
MHELAVTEALLDVALRHAAAAGATRVTEIHVVLGDLASVVDDCVAFYWAEIARGTVCEGARLRFERVPARLRCEDCGTGFGIAGELTPCPACDGVRLRVVAGEECRLESLSVAAPAPALEETR